MLFLISSNTFLDKNKFRILSTENNVFYLFTINKLSWSKAKEECKLIGANLAGTQIQHKYINSFYFFICYKRFLK